MAFTNSQLHFANSLLNNQTTEGSLNPYGLIDLSNLLQSIVLSDKIVTLPGNEDNSLKKDLQNQGILEVLQIDRRLDTVFSSLRDNWSAAHLLGLISENQNLIADRIIDTLSVDKELVLKAVKEANDYANNPYFDTPDHEQEGTHTLGNSNRVDGNIPPALASYKKIYHQTLIQEVYIGALLYFMVASNYKINYSPDSIRIPLTAFFSKQIDHHVMRIVQSLTNTIDEKISRDIIQRYSGFANSKFAIVPSVFLYVMKSCEKRHQLIDEAIKLREDKKTNQYREWLKELTIVDSKQEYSEKIQRFNERVKKANTGKWHLLKKVFSYLLIPLYAISGDPISTATKIPEIKDDLSNLIKNRKLGFLSDLKKN